MHHCQRGGMMRYFESMRDKYGFNDGSAIPDDAAECRWIYIKVINKLAEREGSEYRAYAYNRSGCHNWCLILMAKLSDIQKLKIDNLTSSDECTKLRNDEKYDDKMRLAIVCADNMNLDRFV